MHGVEHNKYILKNVGNQTVSGPHWLFPYYRSQWGPSTVWLCTFYSFFYVNRINKFIKVWNNLRVSIMTEFSFSFLGEKLWLHLLLFYTFSQLDSSYFNRNPHNWEFSMQDIFSHTDFKLTSLWAGCRTLLIDLNQFRWHTEFNMLDCEGQTYRTSFIKCAYAHIWS